MNSTNKQVYIIGAGISGLVAAKVLEERGVEPVIIEATDRIGGRLKTDIVDGFQLDQGFQVLLSSYSAAQKHLNYNALNLQKFKAGACIFKEGKQKFFGDPLRDPTLLFSTLFSGIGTFKDKVKIAQLNFRLQKKSLEEIFEASEITTKQYLKELGFSNYVIKSFFQPFFSGIFLETELNTSSRMFEFVFKMFGDGYAVIPKGGIEEIPKQLKENLKKTTFKFNSKVSEITSKEIILSNGKKLNSNFTIVATEPSKIISNLINQKTEWKSCQNLYFTVSKRIYNKPFIGLIPNNESLINNILYPTSLQNKHKGNKELLSVTVVKNNHLFEEELIEKVKKELKLECNIEGVTFLKSYNITQALPSLNNLQNDISPTETKLKDGVFLAGDVLLNGSLNAAMIAGERAAQGILEAMEKTIVIG